EKFIDYYWRQTVPYIPRASAGGILRQNTGRQAEVLGHLQQIRKSGPMLAAIQRDQERWDGLVTRIDAVVRKMPLWKLQTLGGTHLEFLYRNHGRGIEIELKLGVAVCLRHVLINDLIRGACRRFEREPNPQWLGTATVLVEFEL